MQPNDLDEEMKRVEQKLARRRKKTQGFSLENKEEPLLPYTPIVERKSAIDTLIESSPLIQERYQAFSSSMLASNFLPIQFFQQLQILFFFIIEFIRS